MKKWLHPLFRPATAAVKIKLTGTPKDWIPKLQVADRAEQARLCNHTSLIRTLSKRWTDRAAVTFDVLVNKVRREINAVNTIDSLVKVILMDYQATRGKRSFALLDAAVCEAVLDGRPGYLEEFDDPNPPQLV
ncbi:MAG TPA: hypothetical protein VGM66_08280 [Candidatus Udaeobacter sp.]